MKDRNGDVTADPSGVQRTTPRTTLKIPKKRTHRYRHPLKVNQEGIVNLDISTMRLKL